MKTPRPVTRPLRDPTFRKLFAAQILSLIGIGLLTIGLALVAYEIGGDASGGKVLGLLLALKMVAYVGFAPLAETLLARFPPKRAMVGLDLGRMLLLVPMAFAGAPWQIAALAFGFFVLSAGFTPLFQAVIPDVLPDEEGYTRALAWSRLAYTLESVLSPVAAAVLLKVLPGEALFVVAAGAFLGSVLTLLATRFPARDADRRKGPFLKRALRGVWIYSRTPRLRGLLVLNVALSLAMAWILVNSVVFAGARFGDAAYYYPVLMAAHGLGAGLGAMTVPRLVRHSGERRTMLAGAIGFAAIGLGFSLLPALPPAGAALVWCAFGAAASLVLTPGGLVIARSAAPADRASVFAAQFSLSHAGWLLAYPLAGWLGGALSLEGALLVLSGLCAGMACLAALFWPADDPLDRVHCHPDLPADHPHLRDVPVDEANGRHVHAYRIDDLHPNWTLRPT
jgi:MFS family permease